MMYRSTAIALLLLLLPRSAPAQDATATGNDPIALSVVSLDDEEVRRRNESLESEIAALEGEIETTDPKNPALQQRMAFLEQIALLQQQELAALERQNDLKRSRTDLEERREDFQSRQQSADAGATVIELDRLRDELARLRQRRNRVAIARETSEATLIEAREVLDNHERERRKLEDQAQGDGDASSRLQAASELEKATLETRRAQESLFLHKMEAANEAALENLLEDEDLFLEERIEKLARIATLHPRDLEDIEARLEQEKLDIERQIDSARLNLEHRERKWLEARQRYDEAFSPSEGPLTEEVEFWRLSRSVRQTEMAVLTHQLERLATRGELWVKRLQVLTQTVDPLLLADWREQGEDALARYERDSSLTEGRISELQDEIRALDGRLADRTDLDADTLRWLREQPAQIRNLIEVHENDLAGIDRLAKLETRLLSEVTRASGTVSLEQRWRGLEKRLGRIWLYEIARADDRPITIKKVVLALALVILGVLLSHMVSRLVSRRLLPRVGVEPAGAAAVQSVLFYLLLVLSALFALNYAEVPLTWLTMLGGAVAIGVGFGSQNIVNNFFSGLLLLVERPVKVGDLIEIDDLFGNIVQIGARSTKVVTGANLEIIVPNSTFLQTNVANWTHRENLVRTHVSVGVAYGSPVETVRLLLARAAAHHPKVLRSPPPLVWFTDFGDDALCFEVHFWIRVLNQTEWLTITSEMRFAIDRLFRAAKIVIAFPQRDVHLHAAQPIQVEMTSEGGEAGRRQKAAEFLRRQQIFSGLDAAEIESLVANLEKRTPATGDPVLRQGEEGSSLLIVVSGLLSVRVKTDGIEREVRELYPGDCFGEISLLTGAPRSATVVAVTDAFVYELGHEPLRPILQRRPEIAELLSERMAYHLSGPDRVFEVEDSAADQEASGLASDILSGIRSFFGLSDH